MSTDKPGQEFSPSRPSRRGFLAASAVAAVAGATSIAAPGTAFADSDRSEFASAWPPGPGNRIRPQAPSRELREILNDLDENRMRAIVQKLVSFGTRHTLSSQTDPVRGIGAARDWLFAEMQSLAAPSNGLMTVQKQTFTQPPSSRIPTPTVITNVITTMRGSVTPDRIFVITGHYDSRVTDVLNFTADAPGADDDGSGVANVLELIRVFATRQPKSTIVLAAVAGEEQGLFGSTFMAAQMKAAGADIQGMFSNDIVGSSTADDGTRDPHNLRLFAEGVPTSETPLQAAHRQLVGGESDSASRQLARFVTSVAANEATDMNVRIIYRRDRYDRGSDHIPFLQNGYPAGRFTEPRENFAHQHQDVRVENGVQFGDLMEFMDFGFLHRVIKVNAATLWSLANGPGTPKNLLIDDAVLTNQSTLHWDATGDPDIAGYEVVWRECTEPDWTHAIPVGNVTSATVPLIKDNTFIGVRSVNTAGMHSPVAFPTPNP